MNHILCVKKNHKESEQLRTFTKVVVLTYKLATSSVLEQLAFSHFNFTLICEQLFFEISITHWQIKQSLLSNVMFWIQNEYHFYMCSNIITI